MCCVYTFRCASWNSWSGVSNLVSYGYNGRFRDQPSIKFARDQAYGPADCGKCLPQGLWMILALKADLKKFRDISADFATGEKRLIHRFVSARFGIFMQKWVRYFLSCPREINHTLTFFV